MGVLLHGIGVDHVLAPRTSRGSGEKHSWNLETLGRLPFIACKTILCVLTHDEYSLNTTTCQVRSSSALVHTSAYSGVPMYPSCYDARDESQQEEQTGHRPPTPLVFPQDFSCRRLCSHLTFIVELRCSFPCSPLTSSTLSASQFSCSRILHQTASSAACSAAPQS